MARKHLLFPFLILIALLVSCASVPDNLVVQDTSDVELSMSRGSATGNATVKGIEYKVMGNNVEDGIGSFLVSITNNTDKPFDFVDSDIVILGGRHKWGLWKTLETWDAKSYYEDAVRESRSSAFWTGFAGVMWRVDAILAIVTSREDRYSRPFDFGDYMMGEYLTRSAIDSARKNGDEYLKFLEENLLFSSTIAPGETYTGWVLFDAPRYDYYKVNISSGKKSVDFVMQRESL